MRKSKINRKTSETSISVEINLDGKGKFKISTGIGFLDHMLEQLSKHSLIDINLKAKGCFSRFLGGIVCTVKGHILFFIIFPSLSNNNTSYIKFFEKSNTILFPFFKKIKNQIYELFSFIGI